MSLKDELAEASGAGYVRRRQELREEFFAGMRAAAGDGLYRYGQQFPTSVCDRDYFVSLVKELEDAGLSVLCHAYDLVDCRYIPLEDVTKDTLIGHWAVRADW
jgi:hypothetical protein